MHLARGISVTNSCVLTRINPMICEFCQRLLCLLNPIQYITANVLIFKRAGLPVQELELRTADQTAEDKRTTFVNDAVALIKTTGQDFIHGHFAQHPALRRGTTREPPVGGGPRDPRCRSASVRLLSPFSGPGSRPSMKWLLIAMTDCH